MERGRATDAPPPSGTVDGAEGARERPSIADASRERDASAMIAAGVGVGVIGVVSAAIGGAICPACVVAAPLLVGVGAYRKARARRR